MKIAVSGATGSLGKAVMQHLTDPGHEVLGLGRNVKKIQDLLFDLEKKVESSLAELSKLKNEKNDLMDKNQILINEKNELNAEFRLLDERFKALKIANTISGSENNINETRSEIDSLIREIDKCISQISD